MLLSLRSLASARFGFQPGRVIGKLLRERIHPPDPAPACSRTVPHRTTPPPHPESAAMDDTAGAFGPGPHDMPPPGPVSNPSPTQTHASSDAGLGPGSVTGALPGSSAASAGLGSLPPPPPPHSLGMGPHDPNQPSQSRPCDICRQRKTRCVREDGKDKCVMCTFHGQPCTYLRGPLPRKRRKATDPPEHRSQPNGVGSGSGSTSGAGPGPGPGSVHGMPHLGFGYASTMGMAIPLDHHDELE